MARKVILDLDPGIDDALALACALFDPQLEVVAVTATGGSVPPAMATINVQKIVEQFDPPRWPRIGAAPTDSVFAVDSLHLHGPDGLGQTNLPVAGLVNLHPAEKVLADEIRSAPEMVTIIALGPLTNIARVLAKESQLASQVGNLIIGGGCVTAPGDVTPSAEFNIYCDPISARHVIRSPMTKTIIPLDVSNELVFGFDLLDQLPSDSTRAGAMLRQMVSYAFRSCRQELGNEGIFLQGLVALVAVTNPELFETEEEVACDVECDGELTAGATVFDRRQQRQWRPNTDLVVGMNVAAVRDVILRGLMRLCKAVG